MQQAPPNAAAVAQQMGLPQDAPLGAIEAFLNLSQKDKGANKGHTADNEMKRKAEEAVIAFMKQRGLTFLQLGDRYLVYKNEPKVEGWCDELILKCFIVFHKRNLHQGPIENVATNFLEFCKECRKSDDRKESLVLQKKRPLCATLSMLTSLGQM